MYGGVGIVIIGLSVYIYSRVRRAENQGDYGLQRYGYVATLMFILGFALVAVEVLRGDYQWLYHNL